MAMGDEKNRGAPAAPGENNGASGVGRGFFIEPKPTAKLPKLRFADPPIRRTAKCKEVKGLRVKNQVLGEATDAETDGVRAEARGAVVAVSRAAVPGDAEPRPTAQQPSIHVILISFSFFINPGTSILWCPFVIVMPMISTPFPYIAVHVM
jgi:hypothetical protein